MRIEEALAAEIPPYHAALFRPHGAIQVLAIRNAAAVLQAHRIRQRAINAVTAYIHIAQNRRTIDRYLQRPQ